MTGLFYVRLDCLCHEVPLWTDHRVWMLDPQLAYLHQSCLFVRTGPEMAMLVLREAVDLALEFDSQMIFLGLRYGQFRCARESTLLAALLAALRVIH